MLITERVGDHAFAGLWEFPGGKIRDNEPSSSALRRELREELGIDIVHQSLLMSLEYDYPDRLVCIDFFLVDTWTNLPQGRDGQALKWVAPEALDEKALFPADVSVIRALRDLD